jgi:hypothetical protein
LILILETIKRLSNDYASDYPARSNDYRATIERLSPEAERLSNDYASDYENGMEKPAFKH